MLTAWLTEATGATRGRHRARASAARRAPGHAVDARPCRRHDAELWLRTDPGFGPQSATLYCLRREAAVYRALGPTPMRVAALVAVHPDQPAFLMQRVDGREPVRADRRRRRRSSRSRSSSWSSSPRCTASTRTTLDLPELGAPGSISRARARRDRRVGDAVRGRRRRRAGDLARVRVAARQRARRRRLAGRARAGRHRPRQLHVRRRPSSSRSPTGSSRTGATSTTTSRGCSCATRSSGSPISSRASPTTSG